MAKNKLDLKTPALTGALMLGILSTVWNLVLGLTGQGLLNWLLSVHFLSVPVKAQPLVLSTLAVSVAYHVVLGAVLGAVLALVWNCAKKLN